MNRNLQLFIFLAFCLGVALFAHYLARGAWRSVVQYRTPFVFPGPRIEPAPPLSERLVLVLVDGLRLDASRELPFLNSLRSVGADLECVAGVPSLSQPARATLLTGAWAEVHGVTTNFINTQVQVDSILRRAQERGLKTACAGSIGWRRMFGPYIDEAIEALPSDQLRSLPPEERRKYFDEFSRRAQDLWLRKRPQIMIVDYTETDFVAHQSGANSPSYLQAARRIDRQIEELCRRIDFDSSTLIVTSDHGHQLKGGHGGPEPDVLKVPLVFAGKGIKRGVKSEARQIDIAPTVAALLGLSVPASNQGVTLHQILDLGEDEKAPLLRNLLAQKRAFNENYRARLQVSSASNSAEAESNDVTSLLDRIADCDRAEASARQERIARERWRRLPLVFLGFALPLIRAPFLLRRAPRREMYLVFVGAAVYFAAFYALFWVSDLGFSPTAVNHESALPRFFGKALANSVVALLTSASVLGVLARKAFGQQSSRQAFRAVSIAVILIAYLLAVQVAYVYWRDDIFMRWYMADVRAKFSAYFNLLQLQAIGSAGLFAPLATLIANRFVSPQATRRGQGPTQR